MLVVPRRSRTKFWVLLVLVLVVALLASVSYLIWRQSVPGVRVTASVPRFVGQKTPLTVVVEAARGRVATASVRMVQGGKSIAITRHDGAAMPRLELPLTLEPTAAGFREGGATGEVWARGDFWRPRRGQERAAAPLPFPPRHDRGQRRLPQRQGSGAAPAAAAQSATGGGLPRDQP